MCMWNLVMCIDLTLPPETQAQYCLVTVLYLVNSKQDYKTEITYVLKYSKGEGFF